MIPRETNQFCFPSSPDVSLDFVSRSIRTLGITKLTVSLRTIHEVYIQQLLNEAEWDRKNSADQGGCCPRRPKAEVDNTLRDLQNSSYPMKAEFNNCFIIHSKYFLVLKGVSPLRSLFFRSSNITQSCPQVFSVNCSIIWGGCTFDVIDSIWRRFFPNLVNSSWLW